MGSDTELAPTAAACKRGGDDVDAGLDEAGAAGAKVVVGTVTATMVTGVGVGLDWGTSEGGAVVSVANADVTDPRPTAVIAPMTSTVRTANLPKKVAP